MASSVILSTTVDMTTVLRQMTAEGWKVRGADLAVISPHRRGNVLHFGDYDTDGLHVPPVPTIRHSTGELLHERSWSPAGHRQRRKYPGRPAHDQRCPQTSARAGCTTGGAA
ncbi:Tn3 family transposase, partial [Streptomyces sp. NPDC001719]